MEALGIIAKLAAKQIALAEKVVSLEEALAGTKEALQYVKQVELPNAMAELGVQSFTLSNGEKIEVKQTYFASIPKDKLEDAFHWMREQGYAALIKNKVVAEFGKGEDVLAAESMEQLSLIGAHPRQEMNVHPQTLKAFVREMFEAGKEFPIELFGAGMVTEATIKKGKE